MTEPTSILRAEPKRADIEPFWYPYLLMAPAMVTLTIAALVPFLFAVFINFHEMKFARLGDFAGFANYVELLSDERFWSSLGVALVFVLIAVPLEFMLGLAGALILSQPIWGRSLLIGTPSVTRFLP